MARITKQAELDLEPKRIKAWSISTLNQYNECPRKTYFSKIMRVVEPKNQHLNRGIALHSLLENCLKEKSMPIPEELAKVSQQIGELRALGAIPEMEVAFDKDWNPVDWFAPNCWARVKIDAIVPPKVDGEATVRVVDWKSGKVSEEHEGYDLQLELYQLTGLIMFPTAEKAMAELIFVDHGVVLEADNVLHRSMIPDLKHKWEGAVKALLSDTEFSARPSAQACRYCYYSQAKNKNCEY